LLRPGTGALRRGDPPQSPTQYGKIIFPVYETADVC